MTRLATAHTVMLVAQANLLALSQSERRMLFVSAREGRARDLLRAHREAERAAMSFGACVLTGLAAANETPFTPEAA